MEEGIGPKFNNIIEAMKCVLAKNSIHDVACYNKTCHFKNKKNIASKNFVFRRMRWHGSKGLCVQLCAMSSSIHWWNNRSKPCNGSWRIKMHVFSKKHCHNIGMWLVLQGLAHGILNAIVRESYQHGLFVPSMSPQIGLATCSQI